MTYTIMIGPGEGSVDSTFASSQDALKMARELVRQGRRDVRILDPESRSFSVSAFEHLVENADQSRR